MLPKKATVPLQKPTNDRHNESTGISKSFPSHESFAGAFRCLSRPNPEHPQPFPLASHVNCDLFPTEKGRIWSQLVSKKCANDFFAASDLPSCFRTQTVRAIFLICRRFSFASETKHLALSFSDVYLSKKGLPKVTVQSFAAVCTFVAAKLVESKCRLPSLLSFIHQTNCQLLRVNFNDWETEVMSVLDFNLFMKTPFSVFSFLCELETDAQWLQAQVAGRRKTGRKPQTLRRSNRLALKLIDFASKTSAFCRFSPEIVAGSAYFWSRKSHGLPSWPQFFQTLTSITTDDLLPCAQHLWQGFQARGSKGCRSTAPTASSPEPTNSDSDPRMQPVTFQHILPHSLLTKTLPQCRHKAIRKTRRTRNLTLPLPSTFELRSVSESSIHPLNPDLLTFERSDFSGILELLQSA